MKLMLFLAMVSTLGLASATAHAGGPMPLKHSTRLTLAARAVITTPAVDKHGIERPDVDEHDTNKPWMDKPDIEKVEVEKPGIAKPGMEKTKLEKPHWENHRSIHGGRNRGPIRQFSRPFQLLMPLIA